jgi:GT2 family glycosyltransferase
MSLIWQRFKEMAMRESKTIAVLMTCFNRKTTTLNCLDFLYKNTLPKGYRLEVFLVDDGSSDGTGVAVINEYTDVKIIQGTGSLFWSGGMRLAFATAMESKFDYYLWLNDDSMLNNNCLAVLIDCVNIQQKIYGDENIIVGSMQDLVTGELTYGGNVRKKNWYNQIKMERLQHSNGKMLQADTMNGNCVLIPGAVADRVGNIDSTFVHALGDYDYALRASSLGGKIWVTPNPVGSCINDHTVQGSYEDKTLSLKQRWSKVIAPQGLPPYAWLVYCRRHAGLFWPFIWLNRYVRVILSGFLR